MPVDELTVDELARVTGTTVRNLRALQTQGLLEPPALVGRIGYYGPEHLERLRAIFRLQREGFSLASIGALFRALEAGLSLEQLLGVDPQSGRAQIEEDEFAGWPSVRRGQAIALVPTNLYVVSAA